MYNMYMQQLVCCKTTCCKTRLVICGHLPSAVFRFLFSFFFNGEVFDMPGIKLTQKDWEIINSSDYIVTYIHQWQRNLPEDLLAELATQKPEHTIWINGIEYVRIYKQEK